MKDFLEDVIEGEEQKNKKVDPYVYVTPQMNNYANSFNNLLSLKFYSSFLASTILIAPLQTVITSLQLSVKKHKDIFSTKQERSKQLAKLNTQMTIHEKRKFELMMRAGGKDIPYRAPVYGGYRETIKGIFAQGWTAFYKGLGFRLFHHSAHFYPYLTYRIFLLDEDMERRMSYGVMKLYLLSLLVDLSTNPVQMMENRFTLQNNLQQFRVFRRPIRAMRVAVFNRQAINGINFHFFNSIVNLFARIPCYLSLMSGQQLSLSGLGLFLTGQFLSYPLLTAYRRLTCQTDRHVGMIPTRYSGLYHTLKVMAYQQGPKGLWRAFPLHALQNIIRLQIVLLAMGGSTFKF